MRRGATDFGRTPVRIGSSVTAVESPRQYVQYKPLHWNPTENHHGGAWFSNAILASSCVGFYGQSPGEGDYAAVRFLWSWWRMMGGGWGGGGGGGGGGGVGWSLQRIVGSSPGSGKVQRKLSWADDLPSMPALASSSHCIGSVSLWRNSTSRMLPSLATCMAFGSSLRQPSLSPRLLAGPVLTCRRFFFGLAVIPGSGPCSRRYARVKMLSRVSGRQSSLHFSCRGLPIRSTNASIGRRTVSDQSRNGPLRWSPVFW
jgi:hypothetical protein